MALDEDLKDKRFNPVIDHFLSTGKLRAGDWDDITDNQKDVIKCIDRAMSRIVYGRQNEIEAE